MNEPLLDTVYKPRPGTKFAAVYEAVRRDIYGRAVEADYALLESLPVLWLRALTMYKKVQERRIEAAFLGLERIKPLPEENQTAYLKARKEARHVQRMRRHQMTMAGIRQAEVRVLLGEDWVKGEALVGDVIAAFVKIVSLAKHDEVGEIENLAQRWVERMTKEEFHVPQTPAISYPRPDGRDDGLAEDDVAAGGPAVPAVPA